MESKDFKAVKVSVRQGQRSDATVDEAIMCSGVNIFGHLSRAYMARKDIPEETLALADH